MTDAQRQTLLWGLLMGTVVTAIVGFLLKDKVELFSLDTTWIGIFLLASGCANFLTTWCAQDPEKPQRRVFGTGEVSKHGTNLRIRDAAWIGLAQGLAVLPGLSRSGTTIAIGVALGLEREFAARFSFLLSIPAITGATFLYARELSEIPSPGLFATSIGLSFLVGLGALHLLISVLKKGRFGIFAGYCWCLGLILIGLNLAGGN